MVDIMKHDNIPPRLELFSDAVFAIIITIMVLELHPPEGHELRDLFPLWPIFLAYCLSFLNLYINWQNHHHLLRTMSRPTGRIMLANGHLLFWASLIPFATAWFGEHLGEKTPTVMYTLVFLLYACAYFILQKQILIAEGKNSVLAKAVGSDMKAKVTLVAQIIAVVVAFFAPWVSIAIIIVIVGAWFFPDSRIEKQVITNKKFG
jgi:uncharacterized membrane protein